MRFYKAFFLFFILLALIIIGSNNDLLFVNDNNRGISQENLKKIILSQASLAGEDQYFNGKGYTKIDMDSRRTNFSEEGWEQYQKYVEIEKPLLGKGTTTFITMDKKTELFSEGENDAVIYSGEGKIGTRNWDEMSAGGRNFSLSVSVIDNRPRREIIITGWKFEPTGLNWPASIIPDKVRSLSIEAENGDIKAQTALGEMFSKGFDQDYSQAMKWYFMAAEQGDAEAQAILGRMYERGRGTQKNHVEAYYWLSLAVTQGGTKAPIQELYAVLEYLTPEEIAAADKRAKEWRASHTPKTGIKP